MLLLVATAVAGDWSFTPLPIGDYSSDHGVGYGGYLQVVRRAEPEAEAYQLRLGLQLFWSTGRYRNHWLKADAPSIGGGPWSVEGEAGWEAWEFAPYFGRGNGVVLEVEAPELRYAYDIDGGYGILSLRRDLVGAWDVFATGVYRRAWVRPYADSLLDEEAPFGVDGGHAGRLGLGLIHDTRVGSPDPRSGHATELSVRLGRGLGVHTLGLTAVDRRFLSLSDGLVLATQALVDLRLGEEPFFISHVAGGSRWLALGGPDLLRGYPEGRFRGDGAVVAAAELRWTCWVLGLRGHSLALVPSPFVEIGRVVRYGEGDPWTHLQPDVGLGQRFVWDEELVVRWDMAVGREVLEDGTLEPTVGIWFMFDHAF